MKAPVISDKNEAEEVDEPTVSTTAPKRMEPPKDLPFTIKNLHKKALLKMWHCHHSGIFPTYAELSLAIGVGEKTKSWQCEAWKHLHKGGYIVAGDQRKTFCLSPKGMELASCFCTDEELAEVRAPLSNEELHEKIRKKLSRDSKSGKRKHSGTKIFDILLKAQEEQDNTAAGEGGFGGLTRLELAHQLGTNPDSHSFFYGFGALKRMDLVQESGKMTRTELKGVFDELLQQKGDDAAEETEGAPKTKKRKKGSERLRGGCQLFKLSQKAFLATAPTQSQSIESSN